MKNMTIPELKKHLQCKSEKELINDIVEIYKICSKATEYFNLRANPEYEIELLEHYKITVRDQFFPSRGDSVLDYSVLRKAVLDFEKVAQNPANVAELMMSYVENGVEFTNAFGSIDETFYNNIANMFGRVVKLITNNNLEQDFKERCEKAMENSQEIGWGFGIFMEDCYYSNFIEDEDDADDADDEEYGS